jgi:hypothetical protein
MLCFLAVLITCYSIDPGNYLHSVFNTNIVITLTMAVLTFTYFLIQFILPNINSNYEFKLPSQTNKWSLAATILFALFIAVVLIGISIFPGGLSNNKSVSSAITIMMLIIGILWFSYTFLTSKDSTQSNLDNASIENTWSYVFKWIYGGSISIVLLVWIILTSIDHTTSEPAKAWSIIVALMLFFVLGAFVYKINYTNIPFGNTQKTSFFSLIVNIILYIPCLFVDFFNLGTSEYNKLTKTTIFLVFWTTLSILIYKYSPLIFDKINLQGGKQLLNQPAPVNIQKKLGSYEELNESDNYNYQYGISLWINLDAEPPNTGVSYSKYTSLLNYGNKPNIQYNAQENKLIITVEDKVVYEKSNFLLQKWNNIVFNYFGGTMDIFLNGELVKSNISVVPYMSLDNLNIGEQDGVNGKICNVVYFKKPLTATNMYYLYNMVKDNSPPVSFGGPLPIIPSLPII